MAGKPGNKNAVGNSGGKSLQDRQLAADVRRLALKEIKAVLLEKERSQFKQDVILKLAGSVLPRLNEHTGEDGDPLPPMNVNVLNTSADELLRILTAASANSTRSARRPAKTSSGT